MGEPLFNLARFVKPLHLNISPSIPSIKWLLESVTASIKTGIQSVGVGLSPLQFRVFRFSMIHDLFFYL